MQRLIAVGIRDRSSFYRSEYLLYWSADSLLESYVSAVKHAWKRVPPMCYHQCVSRDYIRAVTQAFCDVRVSKNKTALEACQFCLTSAKVGEIHRYSMNVDKSK
jgi:hypothetical protein